MASVLLGTANAILDSVAMTAARVSTHINIHLHIINIFVRPLPFPGVCPVLCSQRGEYINGECQCNPGWKGKECSLRHDECEVADCNGHGHCVSGKCQCVRGYKGKFCEEGMLNAAVFYGLKVHS